MSQSSNIFDLQGFINKLVKRFSGNRDPLQKDDQVSSFGAWILAGLIFIIILLIWLIAGIYVVQPAEQGAVLRLGRYIETVDPGVHWHPLFIDKVIIRNIDQVNTVSLSQLMLTEKENIVSVSFIVQYKIGDIKDYLFNVVNPVRSLQQILDSAVRQQIGQSQLNQILTTGRAKISNQIMEIMRSLIDRYHLGIVIRDVTMQPATPPEAVKDAFDDVIKAREDRERYINEAENYANGIVPRARGQAMRVVQEAKAYEQQVILKANGDVAKFQALAPVYDMAPKVTAKRMYFDTMSDILAKNHVYIVDNSDHSQNLFYVPLKQWLSKATHDDQQGLGDN